jgi:predicted phage gp36 major capsid-like protein
MDDLFFNVADWLAEEAAQSFAIEEGDAVIRGNGTNKPTGMLTTTPTTAADFASPMRNAAAYMYRRARRWCRRPCMASIPTRLIDMDLQPERHLSRRRCMGHEQQHRGAIAKLKDSEGRYCGASLSCPANRDAAGYPVAIWEQLDDIGATISLSPWQLPPCYTLAERNRPADHDTITHHAWPG